MSICMQKYRASGTVVMHEAKTLAGHTILSSRGGESREDVDLPLTEFQ